MKGKGMLVLFDTVFQLEWVSSILFWSFCIEMTVLRQMHNDAPFHCQEKVRYSNWVLSKSIQLENYVYEWWIKHKCHGRIWIEVCSCQCKWLLPALSHSKPLHTFSITGFLKYCITLKNSIDVVWSKAIKHTCMEWNEAEFWWCVVQGLVRGRENICGEDDKQMLSRRKGEWEKVYKKVCSCHCEARCWMGKNTRATVMARWSTVSCSYCEV